MLQPSNQKPQSALKKCAPHNGAHWTPAGPFGLKESAGLIGKGLMTSLLLPRQPRTPQESPVPSSQAALMGT